MNRAKQIVILGGPSYAVEAKTLFAAMTVQPSAARKALISNTIAALKSAGIWTSLDILYFPAAHDAQAARLNWKAPASFALLEVNSPTFETDRGYTGDNSTSRLRTQWTPNTHGVNFLQDNGSMWFWSRTNGNANGGDIGGGGNPSCYMAAKNGGGNFIAPFNDATVTNFGANADSTGLHGVSRTAAGTKKAWRHGAQFGSDASVASTGRSAVEAWLLGGNSTLFSNKQQSFAAWGDGLSGKEAALYNIVLAYQQGVGAA